MISVEQLVIDAYISWRTFDRFIRHLP